MYEFLKIINILNESSHSQTRSLSPSFRSKPTINKEKIQMIKNSAADNTFPLVEVEKDGKTRKYSSILVRF